MVIIAKKEFNLDLDKYIDDRRGDGSSLGKKFGKMKKSFSERDIKISWPSLGIRNMLRRRIPSEEMPKKEKIPEDEEFSEMEEELEQIHEVEEELEEERENVLKKFFRKLWYSDREVVDEEEIVGEEAQIANSDEETREVLKGLHKWLESLPRDKKSEFKKSEDFKRYKDLLQRLGMIKQ